MDRGCRTSTFGLTSCSHKPMRAVFGRRNPRCVSVKVKSQRRAFYRLDLRLGPGGAC